MAATPETRSAPEVPPPIPPDSAAAWYAPEVRAQYAVHPGVVATVRETDTGSGFRYHVREPPLSEAESVARDRIAGYLADAATTRPRTREGTQERVAGGLGRKFRRVVARLTDGTRDATRRIEYYTLRDVRGLGELTPYALDDRIEVADAASDHLVVHTADFAPARTDLPADPLHLDRFASERVARYTVPFHGFRLPVTVYRERVLGTDPFAVKYAVEEPSLLPGDEALLAACKERIWEGDVGAVVDDRAAFVRERAREFLARRLTAANTRAWLEATRFRLRRALSAYGLALPPLDERFADDRLSDLVYYVLRDFVGEGALTVPIRDPHLEDVEANRVGERIKVVPRTDLGVEGRVPTNLAFEDATAFENVVTKLAAGDGSELTASNPSAKVNLRPADVPPGETIRCAVALPVISEDGPHVSIRKQSPDAMTPVDLLARESVSTEMVALCWLAYEHRGIVLFSGPTGVGKTTLMNAHT